MTRAPSESGPTRTDAIVNLLGELGENTDDSVDGALFEPLAMLIVDAIQTSDQAALGATFDHARSAVKRLGHEAELARGRTLMLEDVARWAQNRSLPSAIASEFTVGGNHHRFLQAVGRSSGLSNEDLQEELGSRHASLVSRIGHELMDRGLVVQHRFGQFRSWELTPRGRATLNELQQLATRAPRRDRSKEEIAADGSGWHVSLHDVALAGTATGPRPVNDSRRRMPHVAGRSEKSSLKIMAASIRDTTFGGLEELHEVGSSRPRELVR